MQHTYNMLQTDFVPRQLPITPLFQPLRHSPPDRRYQSHFQQSCCMHRFTACIMSRPALHNNHTSSRSTAAAATPVSGNGATAGSSRPLYRGNLSGPGSDVAPTTAVDTTAVLNADSPSAAIAAASAPKPVVKFVPKRISLWDAMKFNGPAPELIQGRLAMVGFVMGAVRETQTGETLLQQALAMPWTSYLWLALIVVASLQPITRAAKSEPFGPFTPRAELTNGRAAMLGFAVVAALEWNAGVCFF